LLEDEKNEKTFILKITNNKEWIYYFFKKYPVCYFLISNFIEKQINYLKEIIYHLEKDNKQLFNVFDIKGKITCIELAKGDLHRDNRSVCKIYFEKGTIFYKPRGFKIDRLINEVLLKVDTILKIPKFIDKSTYGYCENILNNEEIINKDSSKTLNYFFELGKVIRIINDLQIEDIINDNIIHSNGYLYLIDIESVFVPKVVYKSNLHGFFNLLEMHSPLSTGTIPNRQGVFEYSNSIILPSKISSDGKIKKIKNQDFFNQNFDRTESDTHLPTFYSIDSTLHFEKYCEILKKGYSKNQLSNLNINSIINEINKFEVRVIFRETVKYFQL
jgi:lantibiotic modifying enzyme